MKTLDDECKEKIEKMLKELYGRPEPKYKRPTITISGSLNFIKEYEKIFGTLK